MTRRLPHRAGALALLAAALAIVRLAGHTVPPQTETYFRVESGVLRVLVRLPMATLADARVPLTARGTLDLPAIRPTLDAAVADFAKSADIMDGDRPLKVSAVAWVVAAKNDASFTSFASAAAHLAGPALPSNTEIGANEGFVDAELDYLVDSPSPRLSVRFNGQRVGGEFLPTQATYLAPSGELRRLRIIGPPRRVSFEPSRFTAATMFLKLGWQRLLVEHELLLFLFCLVIPRRPASSLAIVLAVYVAAGVLAAILPSPPGVTAALGFQLIASLALVIAALQNMTVPRETWVRTVSAVFGVASGVGAGIAGRELLPLAGSHALVCLVLFLGTVAAAALVLTPVLRALVAVVQRLPVPERALTILLSLVPLHMALHRVQADGQLLIDAGGGVSPAAIAHWPAMVAVLSLALLALVVRVSARGQRFAAAGQGPAGPHPPGGSDR